MPAPRDETLRAIAEAKVVMPSGVDTSPVGLSYAFPEVIPYNNREEDACGHMPLYPSKIICSRKEGHEGPCALVSLDHDGRRSLIWAIWDPAKTSN